MAYGENTIQKPTFLANTLTTGTHVISATEESGLVIDFPTENNQNTSDNENFGDLLLYNKADLQLTASAYSYDILLTESGDIGESGYAWKANSDATTEYKGTFNDYVIMPMNNFLNENTTAQNTTINFGSITANYVRIISALEIKDSGNINPGLLLVFVADGSTDDKKVYSVYYAGAVASNWSTPVQISTINTTGRYSGALYKLTDGTVLFTTVTAAARTLTTYKWTQASDTWATYGSTKDLSQFTQVAIGGAAVDDYNTVVMGVCDPSIDYPYPCVLVSYGGTGDWTEPIVLFDYGGPPSIAYKKDGKFLAVWEEHTNRIGNTQSFDILAKESIDGKTWTLLDTEDLMGTVLSDYITPNVSIGGSSYNQFHLPKIAILSDGRIAVIAFYDQNLSYIDNVGSSDYGLALVISDNSVGDSWKYYTKLTHQGVPTTKADTTLHTLIGKTQAELTIGYFNNNVDQYGNCLVVYNNELLYIHSPKPATNTKILLFSRILPNQKTIFLNTPNAVPYHTACLAIPDTATAFWEQEGAGTTIFSYSNEFVDIPAGVTYHADDLSSLNTITFNARGIYGFTSWSCQKFATSDTAKIKFDFVKENDTASANWLGRATEVTMTEAAGTVTIQADGTTIGTISSVNDTKEYEFIFVCAQQDSGLDSTALLLKGFYKQNTSDKWTSLTGYTNALITSSGITACDVHWGSQAGDNSHWRWFYLYTGCPLNTWEATKQAGYYPGEATTTNNTGDTVQRAIRVLIEKGSIKKSGKKIRIKLKNTMGGGYQANYTRVTIAEKETGAYVDNLVDYTEKAITFQDAASITLAAGTETWSDWIDFDFDEEKDYFICLANGVYRIPYLSNKAAITTNFTYYKTDQTEQYNSDWDDPPEETITGGSKQIYIAGVVWEIQVLEDEGNNRDLLNENNLNYKKLTGRKTSVYPQHIQNGIDIYFGGNRGANEDQWLVQTKWLYAKENVILGSPSKEWRSRQDDTAINIVISKGANEYENGSIALINTNFISCNLRRVSDNGLIAALDSTISSLSAGLFSQNGRIVHIIYTGTDDKRYIGKYIKFQNPSGNTEVRKIVSSFKYAATTLAMELDTTPSIASINSMVLYTDRMYSIGTVDAAFTETQLKIEITSQPAYGGYYKIGKCIFGQHLTLNEYRSEGSTHTLTGQVDITKTRAGVMFAGKKGEAYRTITLNFEYADVETQMEVDNFIKYIDFGKHPFIYWDEQSIPDDAILMRMTDQTIPRKHIARGDLFTIEQFTLTEEL